MAEFDRSYTTSHQCTVVSLAIFSDPLLYDNPLRKTAAVKYIMQKSSVYSQLHRVTIKQIDLQTDRQTDRKAISTAKRLLCDARYVQLHAEQNR